MLGIDQKADQKAIKAAFRNLALKYHPDRNKEPGAEERFKEIAEAYAILSDPKKRTEYDTQGFAGVSGFSQEDLFSGINFDDIFGGLNFDFGGGSPFEGFFHRRHKGPARGANIEVDIFVPLELVASGGEEKVKLSRPSTCSACHGTGARDGTTPKVCTECKGTGRITKTSSQKENRILIQQISTCPTCHGRGSIIEHPCPTCYGGGQVEQEEILTVKIPQGIDENMVLRIQGKGMPSAESGGVAGDLFVVVHSRYDPRFERAGADLICHETIHLIDAVLGTTLQVPTLNGSAEVTIPPGIQPGTMLRIKGKGLPEFGHDKHGELYLHIKVQIPEQLLPEERELYEKLRLITTKSPGRIGQHGMHSGVEDAATNFQSQK